MHFISADSAISLSHLVPKDSNQVIIINFWATWCPPCVEEIPLFNEVNARMNDSNYVFYYISMDPAASLRKADKFVQKQGLKGTHFMLERTNLNNFINKVDENWQGSIPYTIVINHRERKVHEGAFDNYLQLWHFIRD